MPERKAPAVQADASEKHQPTDVSCEPMKNDNEYVERVRRAIVAREELDWPRHAPDGHLIISVPELLIPAHGVVVERWDNIFTATSLVPNGAILGTGTTPLNAVVAFERKNHWPSVADFFRDAYALQQRKAAA